MVRFKKLMAAGVLAAAGGTAHAGIPVIDVTAVMQAIQQTLHMLTQIDNQLMQIDNLRSQLQNMSGARGIGSLARDPRLDNYVPLDAAAQIDGVNASGYAGLNNVAKAMRDADMRWNCQGVPADVRVACESALANPYQQKAILRQAIGTANGRIGQISTLINAINGTQDQAAKLEIGARIQGEQALLQHEATRVQMLWMDMQNQARLEEARRMESTAAMINRPHRDVRAFLGSDAP